MSDFMDLIKSSVFSDSWYRYEYWVIYENQGFYVQSSAYNNWNKNDIEYFTST